jgi:hypothetical protein
MLFIPSAENADRVFYINEGTRASPKIVAKAFPRAQKSQTTQELGHDQIAMETKCQAP